MIRTLAIAASLALMSAPATAASLTAEQTVHRVTVTTDEAGNTTEIFEDATLVAPGDTIVYKLTYENGDSEPAANVRLTMPVPGEVVLLEGHESVAGTQVSYSVDNGRNFFARDMLTVTINGEEVDAQANDITHIRWSFTEDVAAGSTGEVGFRAILR